MIRVARVFNTAMRINTRKILTMDSEDSKDSKDSKDSEDSADFAPAPVGDKLHERSNRILDWCRGSDLRLLRVGFCYRGVLRYWGLVLYSTTDSASRYHWSPDQRIS